MEGLKPCPFCGGKAAVAQNASVFLDYRVYCKRCGAETGMYITAIKAVRCWNTRDVRTCKMKQDGMFLVCSECGVVLMGNPRYCPNCGAKVVEE